MSAIRAVRLRTSVRVPIQLAVNDFTPPVSGSVVGPDPAAQATATYTSPAGLSGARSPGPATPVVLSGADPDGEPDSEYRYLLMPIRIS